MKENILKSILHNEKIFIFAAFLRIENKSFKLYYRTKFFTEMKNRLFLVIATVAAVALVTSCAKVPQAALDAAKAALDSAKMVQADVYFPGDFTALNDSLSVMLQNIETKKAKTGKDFKAIKTNAEAIVAKAGELSGNVEVKKAEVKAEAETMITGAKTLLDEAKALVLKAPKGKEGKAVVEEIKNEITVAETSLTDAQTLFDGGTNYVQVVDKVKATTESLNGIIAELKEAMTKAGIKF
jgi:methyl-accepting chemotaxis protein